MRDTQKLLEKPMPKNFKSVFSPTGKDFIIDKYIGRSIWEKTKNKKTRYILMAEALDFFQKEVVKIYGSYYKWQQDWCRRNGFENQYDYKKWIVKNLGFETYDLYQKDLVQKRGFKDRSDYERKRIKKQGFKTTMEYLEHLAKKAGFKSYSERQKHWKNKTRQNKFGEKKVSAEIIKDKDIRMTGKVLSNSSPPVRTSDRKSDTKVGFNTDLKEINKQ